MQNKLKEIISQGEMWVYLIEIWLGKTFFFFGQVLTNGWKQSNQMAQFYLHFFFCFFCLWGVAVKKVVGKNKEISPSFPSSQFFLRL